MTQKSFPHSPQAPVGKRMIRWSSNFKRNYNRSCSAECPWYLHY